jgi:hypothetical protein
MARVWYRDMTVTVPRPQAVGSGSLQAGFNLKFIHGYSTRNSEPAAGLAVGPGTS